MILFFDIIPRPKQHNYLLHCKYLLQNYDSTTTKCCDLAFITTLSKGNIKIPFKPEEQLNPERQLIRYQFFELLIRLALEKFQKTIYRHNQLKSLEIFFDKYIEKVLKKYINHEWRKDRYWDRFCEKVIKDNYGVLLDLYNQYASPINPGEPKVMRLN